MAIQHSKERESTCFQALENRRGKSPQDAGSTGKRIATILAA